MIEAQLKALTGRSIMLTSLKIRKIFQSAARCQRVIIILFKSGGRIAYTILSTENTAEGRADGGDF